MIVPLFALGWNWNLHRKMPLSHALSPAFWVRHWSGTDQYDPKTALLEHGSYSAPEVAITIDDGPDARYCPAIMDVLRARDVPATFFVVGTRVKENPKLTRRIADEGFEIENHTYDHQRLDALKPHEIANELRLCDKHVFEVTGKHTTLMRPPGVQYNDKVLAVAKGLGYVTVSWTVGAHDYENQPAEFIARRVIDRTEAGSIILLHQDTPETAQALPAIIDSLRAQGYRFVTISQMLSHLNATLPIAVSK
jgi:peptidoglycan/xylan/chitin deacetylase (PgdA/CDA1 family)